MSYAIEPWALRWQVAADANLSGKTYPDQSLYPVNSVPTVVRRINNALQRGLAAAESVFGMIDTPVEEDKGTRILPRVRGLERMGERRWDVVLDHGQRIMLPQDRPVPALRVPVVRARNRVRG